MRFPGSRVTQGAILSAIALSGAGGAAAAVAAENNSTPSGMPSRTPTSVPAFVASPHFPTNSSGETYGSSANVTPPDEPDLIYASGKNSVGAIVYGYVRKTNLDAASGAGVLTPAQAAAYDASAEATGPKRIPLYAQNGTSVIGWFTVTPPNGSTTASEANTNAP